MTVRLGINGFGRIGRLVYRVAAAREGVEVAAVNASYSPETLAHLLKYDTVHGRYPGTIEVDENRLVVDGQKLRLTAERDPARIDWASSEVDVVIEATGAFRDRAGAAKHLERGPRKVIITAPAKGEDVTIVYGVNQSLYEPDAHHVISTASCTTNCLAPIAAVLDDSLDIVNELMTAVHAYTSSQKLLDNPYKDRRRARAAAGNIIPTSTGAARAIGKVLPRLDGKLNGYAMRVPVTNVSLLDLVVNLERRADEKAVNAAFKEAADGELYGILGYTEEPLVSSDFVGDPHSSIVDGASTMVIDGMAKVLAWYDNEWGTANRVVDVALMVGEQQ